MKVNFLMKNEGWVKNIAAEQGKLVIEMTEDRYEALTAQTTKAALDILDFLKKRFMFAKAVVG